MDCRHVSVANPGSEGVDHLQEEATSTDQDCDKSETTSTDTSNSDLNKCHTVDKSGDRQVVTVSATLGPVRVAGPSQSTPSVVMVRVIFRNAKKFILLIGGHFSFIVRLLLQMNRRRRQAWLRFFLYV